MFRIDSDNTIELTRGDILFFDLTAKGADGSRYTFQAGDTLRMKVFPKKKPDTVLLQKDFPIMDYVEAVSIFLSGQDTKLGPAIKKPTDYWYEIELNPDTAPQTIVGYNDNGPAVLRLWPEGAGGSPDGDLPEQAADQPGSLEGTVNLTGGAQGPRGFSAYEIALRNGFEGTEAQWLESLEAYTPQKGVDYFTEEDIHQIVEAVIAALPRAEEGAF